MPLISGAERGSSEDILALRGEIEKLKTAMNAVMVNANAALDRIFMVLGGSFELVSIVRW